MAMSTELNFFVRDYWAADYPHVADIWERTGISTPGRGDTAGVIENTLRRNGRLLVMVDKASDTVVGTSWLTNDGRRLTCTTSPSIQNSRAGGYPSRCCANR